jgi:hypothetical protein
LGKLARFEADIDSRVIALDLSNFNGKQLKRDIFVHGKPHRGLFKLVPERCWPWKGFESLNGFEIRYWNEFIELKVSDRLITLLRDRVAQFSIFLSMWHEGAHRACLGYIIESLFHSFVARIDIRMDVMQVTIERGGHTRKMYPKFTLIEEDKRVWEENTLWKKMEVVKASPQLPGQGVKYYRAPDSNQRLWDAVIVPQDSNQPIDVLQITVAQRRTVAVDEFKKLFEGFEDRNFRFFMIRIAFGIKEVENLRDRKMKWVVKNSCMDFYRFQRTVEFYECIFDFEDGLCQYRQTFGYSAL